MAKTRKETPARQRLLERQAREGARMLARTYTSSEREERKMITEDGSDAYWECDVDADMPGLSWGGAQDLAIAARMYGEALDAAGRLDSLAGEIEAGLDARQAAARLREITAQMFGDSTGRNRVDDPADRRRTMAMRCAAIMSGIRGCHAGDPGWDEAIAKLRTEIASGPGLEKAITLAPVTAPMGEDTRYEVRRLLAGVLLGTAGEE